MPLDLRGVEGLAFELMASAVRRYAPIDTWVLVDYGEEVKLPYSVSADPGQVFRLRASVNVPQGKYRWFIKLMLSGNALVKIDGESWGYDEAHTYFPITPGEHAVYIEATPRLMFGQHEWGFRFNYSYLIEVDWGGLALGLKILQLVDLAEHLPADNPLRRDLEELLEGSIRGVRVSPTLTQAALALMLIYDQPAPLFFNRGDLRRPPGSYVFNAVVYGLGAVRGLIGDVEENIGEEEYSNLVRLIEGRVNEGLARLAEKYGKEGVLLAVGHSHIDAAWLWPKSETVRKVLRTFSTIVRLMDEYDFTYIQSSAQYYRWLEELDKGLLGKVSELVKRGRWIIAGGMWVESDTNIIDGESLARQFLYGQRYFLKTFGKIARIGWLPDSFGFSGNLPQIMRKSGIEVFSSWRIVTHELTEFPYHAFTWVGIDGTEIPTQVILVNYNNTHTPFNAYQAWSMYRGKGDLPTLIYPFGYGDGGGGPTREMLEYRDLINRIPGIPTVRNMSEDEFVSILKNAEGKLPKWVGEIHVENFRGTYTTNLPIKELMANAEASLTEAELWATLAHIAGVRRFGKVELDALWKTLLFNQFHDIVPGSAIREVYEEAYRELEEVISKSNSIIMDSIGSLARHYAPPGTLAVFNPAPWSRVEVIKIHGGLTINAECQEDHDGKYVLVEAPPMGFNTYKIGEECIKPSEGVSVSRVGGGLVLENSLVRVGVNNEGDIDSIVLKSDGVNMLREPAKILVHIEEPVRSDAWRFSLNSLADGAELSLKSGPTVVVEGPLISCIEVVKGFGRSTISQRICLRKNSPLVEIENTFNWVDRGVLVKYWLTTIISSDVAYYDIPFGVVKRTTKPEEQAKLGYVEVPALRWVDLSDGLRGIAVIAPSRHGYSASNGRIGLSLLRTPYHPNPWSDQGSFKTSIYIYPHRGDYEDAQVPKVAYEVMHRLRYVAVGNEAMGKLPRLSFLEIKPGRAMLSAFKPSEDSDNEVVLRLYNPYYKDVEVEFTGMLNLSNASEVDLIELNSYGFIGPLKALTLRPFEIKTIKAHAEIPKV